jgi:ankyrin repeat protein
MRDAVAKDDINSAMMLLERGVNVNMRVGQLKKTILMVACQRGHQTIVDRLLKKDAAVNDTDNAGITALMCAAAYGQQNIIDLLCRSGADVNRKTNRGMTALHHATSSNYLLIVHRLVVYGASVNITNNDGKSPLFYAAHYGHTNCIRLLLSLGSNPYHVSNDNRSPLDIVKERGLQEVVKIMEDSVRCDVASLQVQSKRFLLKSYSRRQIIALPLPLRLRQWLIEDLHYFDWKS